MAPQLNQIPDRSIRICADRGGTFCDVHASWPDPSNPSERKSTVVKLLSQDPSNYRDAPTEGIRRILSQVTGSQIPRGTTLPTEKIDYIRLSTTVATNALLERKGFKHALFITKGFKDALVIGNQSRPKIFDLNIRRPSQLYTTVIEVPERVTLVGYTSDPLFSSHSVQFSSNGEVTKGYTGPDSQIPNPNDPASGQDTESSTGKIVRGLSGEAVQILLPPSESFLRSQLQKLWEEGYRSLAVIFVHSYTYPDHELLVGRLAREVGFEHISLSSQLLAMIKFVPRGMSCSADAYLTPILWEYLDGFFKGFDEKLRNSSEKDVTDNGARGARVEFMASDGGLVDLKNFSGLKSILSGPAGGVVGYALTSWDEELKIPVIGIDVGGTSTDVSRFSGRYETVYETTTAGITIQSPQMDINTVAAGGGSCLTFKAGMFRAGPESAGAQPGPVCYRKGGPLAVTDANLFLGRLIPDYFPKIFGKTEDQPLDYEASKNAFEELAKKINSERYLDGGVGNEIELDEIVYGFIKVANETMCRPIRALTEARGYATSKHVLASFGGAGGQHACEIARLLGITTILIHRHSSILSAYGLALADRAYEVQEPCSEVFLTTSSSASLSSKGSEEKNISTLSRLTAKLDSMTSTVKHELERQGFDPSKPKGEEGRIEVERMLNMRFEGTDTALMILEPESETKAANANANANGTDWVAEFKRIYKEEFGFLLESSNVVVDDIKVRGLGKTFSSLGPSVFARLSSLRSPSSSSSPRLSPVSEKKICKTHSVYFDKIGRVPSTPVYLLGNLEEGDIVKGPAMIIDDTQTIIVDPESEAMVVGIHLVIELR